MAEFLEKKRKEIDGRLNELRPLVEEYERLRAAAAALDGVTATSKPSTASPRAELRSAKPRARQRGATSHGAGSSSGRGRPKGSGTRGKEALELVKATPGITIPEIAEKMGIKQNYLYRVLPSLAEEGLITKDGRGWRPKVSA
jgi:hypothetical protein